MDAIKDIVYELKPYICLGLGSFVFLLEEQTPVPYVLALMLIGAAVLILRMRLKNRRGSPVEQLIYDATPIVYLLIGGYAVLFLERTKVVLISASLLIFAGAVILKWRTTGSKT